MSLRTFPDPLNPPKTPLRPVGAGPARAPSHVLGLDPGFASFGWAVIEVERMELVEAGVIRTKKASRKRRLSSASDARERAQHICEQLDALHARVNPLCMCMEEFSPPRSSSVASKVARAFGMVDMLAGHLGTPVFTVTPMELKRLITGRRTASKADVANALRGLTGSARVVASGEPKGQHEHMWDAAAAALACMEQDGLRLLMRRSA